MNATMMEMILTIEQLKYASHSEDLADVVRKTGAVLEPMFRELKRISQHKSVVKSAQFRKEGNLQYVNKDYKRALVSYNKALAHAPPGSLEMKLAYANTSAVMQAIKAYDDCQANIKAALDLDCPAFLRVKLEKRQRDIIEHISVPVVDDMFAGLMSQELMYPFGEFVDPKNADIPCASVYVAVNADKQVVAARDMVAGKMLALERAFVSVPSFSNEYISCFYCHKLCFFFVPCEGCTMALFCSKQCQNTCLAEFHRVECDLDLDFEEEVLSLPIEHTRLPIRAAIKMSLKLSWDQLRIASLEMGHDRLKKSSVREAFDVNNSLSMVSYDDRVTVKKEYMLLRAVVCALAVSSLEDVPDYLPEDEDEKRQAIDALSRIMLHLSTTFKHTVSMTSTASDYYDYKFHGGAQYSKGWFSFTSKLAHSCEPNLLVFGFNDRVALVSLQRIKKGDQLTISYVGHFYEHEAVVPVTRQQLMEVVLGCKCGCRVCARGWNDRSHVRANLTREQKRAYNQFKEVSGSFSTFSARFYAASAALTELTGCLNTTQHYEAFKELVLVFCACQHEKLGNKIYRYQPF